MNTWKISSLICSSLLVAAVSAQAGFLEVLSSGAKSVHTLSTCPDYSKKDAVEALDKAMACENPSGSLEKQTLPLADVQKKIEGDVEDKFFSVLAVQHAGELVCASRFAEQVAKGDAKADKLLTEQLRVLRQAKSELKSQAQSIAKSPLLAKVCPLTITDLERDYPAADKLNGDNHTACKKLIQARAAYDATLTSIPLANFPSARKSLNSYVDGKSELSATELKKLVRQMYSNTKSELLKQAQDIRQKAQREGGTAFSRSDRHALLSDPRLTEKVIANGDNSEALKAVACTADGRYGSGAKMLDRDLFVVSMATTGGMALKAVGAAAKIAQAAQTSRAMGFLSLNSSSIIQIGAAAGVNAVSTWQQLDKACSDNMVKTKVQAGEACEDAPTLEKLEQDNCYLAGALSAMQIGTTAAAGLKVASYRIAKNLPPAQQEKVLTTSRPAIREPLTEIEKAKLKKQDREYWDLREKREAEFEAQGLRGYDKSVAIQRAEFIDDLKKDGVLTHKPPSEMQLDEAGFIKGGKGPFESKAGDVRLVTEEQIRELEKLPKTTVLYDFRTGKETIIGIDDFDLDRRVGKFTQYGFKVEP